MKHIATLGAAAAFAFAASLTATHTPAVAADYPDKTVLCIVPFGAGGGTDRWARVMSSVGFDVFDKGMRIQNRGGAGGTVGWKHMLDKGTKSPTILLASPTPVIAALLEKKPPFDPRKVKIAAYYSIMKPTLVAPKGKPYSTWDGLVKYLKENKGKKPTIGGTITQALGPASLLSQLGLADKVILVTYSGTGKAVNDFLGGHIDMVAVTTSTAVNLASKASIVVNATNLDYPKKAAKALGKVPNAKSLGLKAFNPPRFIAMHPDTPDAEVATMSKKLGEMLKMKPVKNLIGKLGEDIIYVPAAEANKEYQDVIAEAKKHLGMFK
jgi:tripartite-type tricarboxylate transporter receptor subunit TctC